MNFDRVEGPRDTFVLHGQRAIQLQSDGIVHPRSPGRRAPSVFTPYEDVTHLACSPRALWLGTAQSVYIIARRSFVDSHGPERLVRALLAVLSHRPGGSEQLVRMAEIEELARTAPPPRASWGLAVICVALYALELVFGPNVGEAGYYSPALVRDGDWWRVITANLLHADLLIGLPGLRLHLILNMVALLVIGSLVERPLGAARTLCVMGAAGVGAMGLSDLAGYPEVVGASGVVFGLAASLLWLDVRWPERLPAWWRIPRRTLLLLLAFNAVLALAVPMIAGAAHVGGFAAGLAASALVAPRPPRSAAPDWIARGAATLVAAVSAASVGLAGYELFYRGEFGARHAARLAKLPEVSPIELNNRAWAIAISPASTRQEVEAALLLAERAVEETDRSEPSLLDTLAEIQFRLGWLGRAIETINEAIAQAPDEPYYQEQRRRFTGERSPDDRPADPRWPPPRPGEPDAPAEDPGVRV